LIADPLTRGRQFANKFIVETCDNFEYKDPVDGSISKNQVSSYIEEEHLFV